MVFFAGSAPGGSRPNPTGPGKRNDRRAFQRGEEYRIIRADGTVRRIRARSFPVFQGETLLRTVGIAHDVTTQKLLESELEDENAFGKAIVENAAHGICVCHEVEKYPYVHFTVWNPRMTEITGYELSETNRLGWYQTLYPDPELLCVECFRAAPAFKTWMKARQLGGSSAASFAHHIGIRPEIGVT